MFAIILAMLSHSPHILADLEPPIPLVVLTPKEYAEQEVVDKWGFSQWEYFNLLIQKESKWIPDAQNPHSTAYGLGQFLNSTWKIVGCEKTSDPKVQLDCTIKYVEQRYKTPQKAIEFHKANNWY